MTFEEWFEQAYPEGSLGPREMRELCKAVARAAWEDGYDEGVADSDPAVEPVTFVSPWLGVEGDS